ncbi:MAG TPA: hypothetical protein VGR91_02165 [Stellaceae bacterium]|nr:hypothetical protein [Stellaceae bacterium]
MVDELDFISPYLLSPARSLGEACRALGRDEGGAHCPVCRLREMCQSEARWIVRRPPPPAGFPSGGYFPRH